MTDLQKFQKSCAALWGPQYKSEAARQLQAGLRSVMRWDAGERAVPADKLERLQVLLLRRQGEIAKLLEVLP